MKYRGTSTSDDPDDRDDQEPEYELVDHGGGVGTGEPEYELVDLEPPPPDDKVIEQLEARAHISQRSWLLGTLIVVTVVVILSDIALSAALPEYRWTQVQPEVDDLRNSLLSILLVIIGFYFGERRRK
jgi:hypothetical protein